MCKHANRDSEYAGTPAAWSARRCLRALPRVGLGLVLALSLVSCAAAPEAGSAPSSGEATEPLATYRCVRAETAPAIDGLLTDACWRQAEAGDISWSTPIGRQSTQSARFRFLWDDVYLYFAAEAEDRAMRATETERDAPVWREDCVEFFIDPEGGGELYYELDFNSGTGHWDSVWLLRKGDRSLLLSGWTPAGLDWRSTRTETGWQVEGRIRLSEFVGARHVPPWHGDEWRVNVYRIDVGERRGDTAYVAWAPTNSFQATHRFGRLLLVDEAGAARFARQRDVAERIRAAGLPPGAVALAQSLQEFNVHSPADGPYKFDPERDGWRAPRKWGRLTMSEETDEVLPDLLSSHPHRADDPTIASWRARVEGELLVLARLPERVARRVDTARADGVCVEVRRGERTVETLRVRTAEWQAARVPVKRGESVSLIVSSGPAASLRSDTVILGLYEVGTGEVQGRDP